MTPDSTDTCAPIIFRDRADFDARVAFQERLIAQRDHTPETPRERFHRRKRAAHLRRGK